MAYWVKFVAALGLSLKLLPVLPAPQSTAGATPQALVEKAISLRKADKTLPRYTYFRLDHAQNRMKNGKLFLDTTTLYEYIWIGDRPYGRVVELQGKALRGKALADEQARYDKAVADHEGLDTDARAKAKHYSLVDTGLRLETLLPPIYTISELRQEVVAGLPTHVIDCTPTASKDLTQPSATRHVMLWLTDAGVVLRDTYELVADEPDKLRGSHREEDFQLIDGNRLPLHTLFHLNAPNGNTGDFEDTYARFRRFSTSMRIVPATDSPQ